MKNPLLNPPSLENLIQAGKNLIDEFDPKKFIYLNSKGEWKENPENPIDRISNELLHQIGKLEQKALSALIRDAFFPLSGKNSWALTKKMKFAILAGPKNHARSPTEEEMDKAILRSYSSGDRPEKIYPFLIILEVLAWILYHEAVRASIEIHFPDWDRTRRAQQKEFIKELESLNHLFSLISDKGEIEQFIYKILDNLKKASSEVILSIPKTISEEMRLMKTLNHLLEKAKDSVQKEEIFSLVYEKIQPPMGIVNLASPALLFPCLQLLMDKRIDISSGIQYNASVILSILQDPRSTETLLDGLDFFPLYYSKIRENLIYTLGNLKEKRAVKPIARILEGPDQKRFSKGPKKIKIHRVLEQKMEAIWALGKIGIESIRCLFTLVKYGEHPSAKLKTYLAWTLGEIGKAQKEKYGGVSADIIITLLKLLKTKNKQLFEETVSALQKIDVPEFTHSLYLYNIGAVSLLGLKPAQRGLYELSETLHYLINSKGKAIIAVNGDSGTGKTYFCQSILNGFGKIKPNEILYLMRDRSIDQKIFNRILGLKWLKKYIDPVYYQDYPVSEEEDDPEQFFKQFLEENSSKKLIILDGCRDRCYFQRLIDLFYFKGNLDVEVNFRATFSTRRLNLEEREMALESVNTHLSFVEEPALEDTHFYQEGMVILYDLDNSIPSRLRSEETQELFQKRRIDTWGDLIRIGDFREKPNRGKVESEPLSIRQERLLLNSEDLPKASLQLFSPEERKFRVLLNENLTEQPNLLQTIEADDLKAEQMRFYAQDQIAGIGEEGSVFVLTFLDNRIFYTLLERSSGIALLGRDIYLINDQSELTLISFERNEIVKFEKTASLPLTIVSYPPDKIITGHEDGTVRIWNFLSKDVHVLAGHRQPVLSLAVDHSGRIYSAGVDGTLRQWDLESGMVHVVEKLDRNVPIIKLYPQEKILAISEADDSASRKKEGYISNVKILDFQNRTTHVSQIPFQKTISSVNVYFDGRIIAGASPLERKTQQGDGNLIIISPGKDFYEYSILDGHQMSTKDCLAMGPKIITCGTEGNENYTIRLWGTDFYVRTELSKLSIKPSE
jgi:HEAT repeat protein